MNLLPGDGARDPPTLVIRRSSATWGGAVWGQGYCTEAARAVLDYAFGTPGLARVYARQFRRNPASGRVMQKLGMAHEGCLGRPALKWGKPGALELYGILREERRRVPTG